MFRPYGDITPEERRMIDQENRERRQFVRTIKLGQRRRYFLPVLLMALVVIAFVMVSRYWLTHVTR
mgnify:CR=1 FL=1